MKRIVSLCLLVGMLIITQTGCQEKEQKEISESGFYLDTNCTITIYADNEESGKKIIKDAFELCRQCEEKMSKTIKGSDVYRINNAKGKPVKISKDTRKVVELGLEMSEESKGKFDITVGRLTDLWNFKAKSPKVPSQRDITRALKTVGYKNVKVNGNKVSIQGGGKIDLGGLAKGYISEKVAQEIEKSGVKSGIINFGGNVVTIGNKPDGSEWKVGIQDPNKEGKEILGATKASGQAVITSGIYERKFISGGRIYHHIIDPDTGYPADNEIEGVTIKCDWKDADRCDAYSTICLLMGKEKGKEFIESKDGFEALFYTKSGERIKTEEMDFEKAGKD